MLALGSTERTKGEKCQEPVRGRAIADDSISARR